MLLRIGLEIADRVVAALPSRVAYAVADLAGEAWCRLAPARRGLVEANLARVCVATGRPTRGRPFVALVRSAFRNHARYYVELLRTPHYRADRIREMVDVPDWDVYAATMASGATIFVSSHLGNFEPFGVYLAAHGIRPLSPIEEIEPRALFEFLSARRGGGAVELVPVSQAGAPLRRRLREGGVVGIVGDRALPGGAAHPVTMFGHATTIPVGPAMLAVTHGAAVVIGRCLRVGPDRFRGEGEVMEVPSSGDRRADIATLAQRMAARFERDIGAAPEQWWGAFQPYWPDQGS
jgi:lauroyl/myristoyl acyltransferase